MNNHKFSQKTLLLNHFKQGGVTTSLEAYIRFGITQLSTRIGELEKNEGIIIKRTPIKKNGKRIIQYSISAADIKDLMRTA